MTLIEGLTDLSSALGSLQSASSIIKTLSGLRTDSESSAQLAELNRQIMAAQTSAIQANTAQFALIERVRKLEADIVSFETWNTEKKRYELKEISRGSFAYILKEDARGSEPIHHICQICYEKGNKTILQLKHPGIASQFGKRYVYYCPSCKTEIAPSV
jgi:hypothetical protein